MPKQKKNSTAVSNDGATIGYEARLWQMADALRGRMDAAEYKHVAWVQHIVHHLAPAGVTGWTDCRYGGLVGALRCPKPDCLHL